MLRGYWMQDSTDFIRKSWKFLGHTGLSLWLIYALFADIITGSIIMKHHPQIFSPLQDQLLQEWAVSYGVKNMFFAWWFFVALLLLFLLALTTAVCGTNKLMVTIDNFRGNELWRGLLKLSPSIVHLGFFLLLLGQLASHTIGVNSHGNILAVGEATIVPGTEIKIVLKDLKIAFFGENTRFPGMAESPSDCSAILCFIDSTGEHQKKISLNQPCWYRGWSFFIEDFCPKTRGSKRLPFINMTIRNDPGIMLMVAGALVFGLGLAMYLFIAMRPHSNHEGGR